MVQAGLWDGRDGGYWVHDYLDYNPSRAEVLSRREQQRRAGRHGGKHRATQAQREPKGTFLPSETPDETPDATLGERLAESYQTKTRPPSPSPSPSTKYLAGDSAPAGERRSQAAAGSGRKTQPADPNIKRVIDAYHTAFRDKYGSPPPLNGGKCGAIAKQLLQGRPVEEAVWLVREFIAAPPQFYADKNLCGMEHVRSAALTLLARRAAEGKR